jgi:hypothetical protein
MPPAMAAWLYLDLGPQPERHVQMQCVLRSGFPTPFNWRMASTSDPVLAFTRHSPVTGRHSPKSDRTTLLAASILDSRGIVHEEHQVIRSGHCSREQRSGSNSCGPVSSYPFARSTRFARPFSWTQRSPLGRRVRYLGSKTEIMRGPDR